jgi:ATP/maltotriose-dependent transcriptional regulator MalT
LPAAEHALSLGETLTESHGHCALCEALLLPVAVSVRIAQGEHRAAESYCRRLDEATTRYGSYTWVALAAQARGELAIAEGDIEAAKAYYTAARAGFEEANNEQAASQCTDALARLQ